MFYDGYKLLYNQYFDFVIRGHYQYKVYESKIYQHKHILAITVLNWTPTVYRAKQLSVGL